jgi:hypothetical protein
MVSRLRVQVGADLCWVAGRQDPPHFADRPRLPPLTQHARLPGLRVRAGGHPAVDYRTGEGRPLPAAPHGRRCCTGGGQHRRPPRPSGPGRLQLPQFYNNYKNKSAEALSPWFLAQWLLVRPWSDLLHAPQQRWQRTWMQRRPMPPLPPAPSSPAVGVCHCVSGPQGDTFNLLGCLMQGEQLPTTTYTAM